MHGSLQISIRQLDKTGRQRQISRQNWTTKTNFSTKLDDKVQSGLRPSYKTRALCRQKSVAEKQPEKPQQHQPWRCQGSSWESEDEELKENTEVEEVFFDNIDKEVEEEVFDNKEEEVDEEVGSIDKEVDNIDIEVDNIDIFLQVSVGDYDETNNL